MSSIFCRLGFHNPDFWEARCLHCDSELLLSQRNQHGRFPLHRYRVRQPEDETTTGGTE